MQKNIYKLNSLINILDKIFKPELALDWDNTGLLVGNLNQKIEKILLCIDLTPNVLKEAIKNHINLIISYHPPIFKPIKNIISNDDNLIYESIKHQIAIYSPHTALDIIDGGTSDVLADLIDLEHRKPIETTPQGKEFSKLTVFVPVESADIVANAIFQAGGGVIGEYRCCSFRTKGTGTFMGSEKSHPTIGKPQVLEQVDEYRLEVIIENSILSKVITEMLKVHPYEEPAFEIYPLKNPPTYGIGRIGTLPKPLPLTTLIKKIKTRTTLKYLIVADSGKKQIKTSATCPGAGDSLLEKVAGKVDLFLTGEIRHHTALLAIKKGTTVICLGHNSSEQLALKTIKEKLQKTLPNLSIHISKQDKEPFNIL